MNNLRSLLILLLTLLTLGCSKQPGKNKVAEGDNDTILIRINRNIETMGILCAISSNGEWVMTKTNAAERSELYKLFRKQFSAFSQHPAVKKLNELSDRGIFHIYKTPYALDYTELPEFRQYYPFNELFYQGLSCSREETMIAMDSFAILVRDFYEDAALDKFFTEQNSFYSNLIAEVQSTLPTHGLSTSIRQYYGETSPASFTVIPSPVLVNGWGFSHTHKTDTLSSFFQLLSPYNEAKHSSFANLPKEALGFNDTMNNRGFCVHEFGHSFTTFLEDSDQLELVAGLSYMSNEKLRQAMSDQGESDEWQTIFAEHLVRAVEVRIWEKLGENTFSSQKLKAEKEENGFVYISDFTELLKVYESQRDIYPNLKSYLPVLIEQLGKKYRKI